jgi:hypothetical protein
MDRFSLHETEIDLRDVLKVYEDELRDGGGCHGWIGIEPQIAQIAQMFLSKTSD